MKRILAILLLVQFSFQIMGSLKAVLQYELLKDHIAAVLCEKKEIKGNSCQGQCHLNKELKEAADEEENHPSENRESRSADWICNLQFSLKPSTQQTAGIIYLPAIEGKTTAFHEVLLRPPIGTTV